MLFGSQVSAPSSSFSSFLLLRRKERICEPLLVWTRQLPLPALRDRERLSFLSTSQIFLSKQQQKVTNKMLRISLGAHFVSQQQSLRPVCVTHTHWTTHWKGPKNLVHFLLFSTLNSWRRTPSQFLCPSLLFMPSRLLSTVTLFFYSSQFLFNDLNCSQNVCCNLCRSCATSVTSSLMSIDSFIHFPTFQTLPHKQQYIIHSLFIHFLPLFTSLRNASRRNKYTRK